MGEVGILAPDKRVELIEGEILEMSPIGPAHMMCVLMWSQVLGRLLGDRALVSAQGPIAGGTQTEPQPDVAVLRAKADGYWDALPQPDEVLLIIEVSDSSLAFDRGQKVPLYARAGIPQVIVTNLVQGQLESYTDPLNGVYRVLHSLGKGERIELVSFPGLSVAAADVLR